ncbi:oligopeptidase B [Raphidocelis subcapitata]|uniref:Prolyl endopeptidase-like n=1 Tax=Raphidocelis subcapitata TaxID=307507 RepID=A0A2V0NWR5_9CHLO|nr:oligopeptidase B [Raphidocelis subcapitata]|eukprot:GBF89255.1 oligopeptidase B [Raphidocelis subcapitata]
MAEPPPEPVARRDEKLGLRKGNGSRPEAPPDPYGWMRDDDRRDPKVLSYIEAENDYATAALSRLAPLADALADEMDAPLPRVEWRPPAAAGRYEYAERRGPGDDHWDVYRRQLRADGGGGSACNASRGGGGGGGSGRGGENGGGWELAAPFNRLASGFSYFDVARWAPSPDGGWLAFAVDTRGDEEFAVHALQLPLPADGACGGGGGGGGGGGCGGGEEDDAWEGPGAPALVARGAAGGGQLVWASDGSALLLLEQPGSHERQGGAETRVVRARLGRADAARGRGGRGGRGGGGLSEPEALLRLAEGALDLELSASASGEFLMLKYSGEEGHGVLALPMAAAASAPAIAAAARPPRGALPPDAVAAAPGWRAVLPPARGQDCLAADHWRGDTFVLLVDDSDSPDGRVELVTAPASSGDGAAAPAARRQALVGGWGSPRRGASTAAPASTAALEVNGFALMRRHAAVAVRRNGACVVLAYDLEAAARQAPDVSENGGGSSSSDGGADGDGGGGGNPTLPPPAWELSFGANSTAVVGVSPGCPFDSPTVRLTLESFVAPKRVEALDLSSEAGARAPEARAVIFEERLAPGFDAARYQSRLEWAASHDGVKVPMTVAWRRDRLRRDGGQPAILWGYGAYGSKQYPAFNPADVALLDRGFVLAVAHPNTFQDLLACARHLSAAGYTSPALTALWGRSAGGLAVAGALNLDPSAARAAVLDVPFLDVLGTMLDLSLLLTVKERPEWGDPLNDEAAFKTIASYSPYQNLRAGVAYPHMLLTASLWDRRVCFWEPLKFVAKLRYLRRQRCAQASPGDAATNGSPASSPAAAAACDSPAGNTRGAAARRAAASPAGAPSPAASPGDDDRMLLLVTDMEAGHFAASGAGERLRQRAEKAAFIITALGWEGTAAGGGGGSRSSGGGGSGSGSGGN